jgi:hypothetical protein
VRKTEQRPLNEDGTNKEINQITLVDYFLKVQNFLFPFLCLSALTNSTLEALLGVSVSGGFSCPLQYKETLLIRTARSMCRSFVLVEKIGKMKRYEVPSAWKKWNKKNPLGLERKTCEKIIWLRKNCMH